jgi:adenylate cyclase class 2
VARETEIKIPVPDAEAASRRLETLGGVLASPRALEDNRLFDFPGLPLARSGRLLRIRESGGKAVVTAKGPSAGDAAFKVRQEIETEVADPAALASLFELLGLVPVWRYQKYRRGYRLDAVTVVVDETPHGAFVEIEGEPDGIEAASRRLGFDRSSWSTATYREIHERFCASAGVPCGDMLFDDRRRA